jgi:Phage portal protein.
MVSVRERLKQAWNVFRNEEDRFTGQTPFLGPASYGASRPDRTRLFISNERTIIASIYTRIAIDVAQADFRHVRVDDNGNYIEEIDSGLNECLKIEANIDQSAKSLLRDAVITMLNDGAAAIVPVTTVGNPELSGDYDIRTLRVGTVTQFRPRHLTVNLYNEDRGERQEVTLSKRNVALADNPLYYVMNEPNSTLQRLIRKLNMLDTLDERTSSGKLDLIIQLPYVVKSEARRQQAEQRRSDLEFQLKGSQYGIAYTDGTEKITQLNRPAENQLMAEIVELKTQLYSELGINKAVMEGSADEAAMLNYRSRTLEPISDSIVDAMKRTFLTKTARTQKQSVEYYSDPFKLVPVSELADIADKFTRNEILTANEVRSIVKMKPSTDPKADELRNANMPAPEAAVEAEPGSDDATAALDEVDKMLDDVFQTLGVEE